MLEDAGLIVFVEQVGLDGAMRLATTLDDGTSLPVEIGADGTTARGVLRRALGAKCRRGNDGADGWLGHHRRVQMRPGLLHEARRIEQPRARALHAATLAALDVDEPPTAAHHRLGAAIHVVELQGRRRAAEIEHGAVLQGGQARPWPRGTTPGARQARHDEQG